MEAVSPYLILNMHTAVYTPSVRMTGSDLLARKHREPRSRPAKNDKFTQKIHSTVQEFLNEDSLAVDLLQNELETILERGVFLLLFKGLSIKVDVYL